MAIKVGGTTVIDDSRNLVNIVSGAGASTTAGDVGTYAMAGKMNQYPALNFGGTMGGSSLTPRSASGNYGSVTSLSGTWRLMGYNGYETNHTPNITSVWVRIS